MVRIWNFPKPPFLCFDLVARLGQIPRHGQIPSCKRRERTPHFPAQAQNIIIPESVPERFMASGSGSGLWSQEEEERAAAIAATTDVELLKRAWRNEKAAPEILHFESQLIQRSREQIQLLVSKRNPKP